MFFLFYHYEVCDHRMAKRGDVMLSVQNITIS